MKTINEISDKEILAILNSAMNDSFEKKQARKREKLNAAFADFFNIGECGFVEA